MLKKLFSGEYKKYTIINIVMTLVTIGLGVFWHFLFDLSGENRFIGLFTPVNESVWEHLKILFFPFIVTMIIEYFIYGKRAYNFYTSKLFGLTVGLLSVITNYYTATGAFGINNMLTNIGIYVLSVILAYALSYMRMLKTPKMAGGAWESSAIFIMGIYFALFLIFTYYPLHIPLFRDPSNMNYSIQ